MIHMKCQDLFSLKKKKKKIECRLLQIYVKTCFLWKKKKKIECRLLQILLGALRVNRTKVPQTAIYLCSRKQKKHTYLYDSK